ncbi:MAG TPA: FkbM family methyltransferase [Pyrinomonadaceae bacterium]|nr:FkbM family methyltransferase [Pyrinomonadaceae bacterium]
MAKSFRSPGKVIRRLKLMPQVARNVQNWPSFMYHYALGLVPRKAYRFRNGVLLKIQHATEHVPIMGIFLRSEYGTPPGNATIVDLGANIGAFSVYAGKVARNTRVFAYEPFDRAYHVMRQNVALNELADSISCFNYAVAGTAVVRELFVSGTDFFFPTLVAPARPQKMVSQQVRCITLAEIIDENRLDHVDLLKMDVEGGEYDILYQTPYHYFSRIREIRMEYHNLDQKEQNLSGLRLFLTSQGYTITHERATSGSNGLLWASR